MPYASRERRLEYLREWQRSHPDYWKQRDPMKYRDAYRRWQQTEKGRRVTLKGSLKHHYGLTLEEYDVMLARQGGVCAICRQPPTKRYKSEARLNVDHDHETGEFRGLLCGPCNRALGQMREDPAMLRRAADYLERGR